jgi:hypothetical protein
MTEFPIYYYKEIGVHGLDAIIPDWLEPPFFP